MRDWVRKTEAAAHCAIIVRAIFIVGVFVKTDRRKPLRQAQTVAAGARLSIPDMDWSKRDRTLLMVLQQNCSYCTENAPFYRRVVQETRGNDRVGLIAI